VNPGSLILSGEMMLRYMGWVEAADAIIGAMDRTIAQKTVTYDFARLMEGSDRGQVQRVRRQSDQFVALTPLNPPPPRASAGGAAFLDARCFMTSNAAIR
jgi:hypothetical protein